MAYTPRRGHWPWALGMDAPMDEGDLAASPESLTFTSSLPHTHRQEATQGFLPVLSLPVNSGHWPMQYASPLQMLLGGSHWAPMVVRSSLHPRFSSHRGEPLIPSHSCRCSMVSHAILSCAGISCLAPAPSLLSNLRANWALQRPALSSRCADVWLSGEEGGVDMSVTSHAPERECRGSPVKKCLRNGLIWNSKQLLSPR